ncbi:MAG: hypothetical protein VW520_08990, partial [Candidatus Puniceispirillum sp.]
MEAVGLALETLAVATVLNLPCAASNTVAGSIFLIKWALPWSGFRCDCLALQNKIHKRQFAMLVVLVEFVIDSAKLDQFLPLMHV